MQSCQIISHPQLCSKFQGKMVITEKAEDYQRFLLLWDSPEALYAIVVYYTARAKQLCQIFCRSSTSLTPVTQDHLYSINPIQAQEISCNATQFEKFNFIKHAVVSRYFPPAERKAKNKIIKGSRKSLNKSRIRSHGFVSLTISRWEMWVCDL